MTCRCLAVLFRSVEKFFFYLKKKKDSFFPLKVDEVYFVEIDKIQFKVADKKFRKRTFPGVVTSKIGDAPVKPMPEVSIKGQAIYDHFINNIPWRETKLFQSFYRPRLQSGEKVKGVRSIDELESFYNDKVDRVFASIKKEGFLSPLEDKKIDAIYVHIGKNGEVIYGNNGNHRYFMAKVLGIDKLPCCIWGRHEDWEKKRQKVKRLISEGRESEIPQELHSHFDVQKLLSCIKS